MGEQQIDKHCRGSHHGKATDEPRSLRNPFRTPRPFRNSRPSRTQRPSNTSCSSGTSLLPGHQSIGNQRRESRQKRCTNQYTANHSFHESINLQSMISLSYHPWNALGAPYRISFATHKMPVERTHPSFATPCAFTLGRTAGTTPRNILHNIHRNHQLEYSVTCSSSWLGSLYFDGHFMSISWA